MLLDLPWLRWSFPFSIFLQNYFIIRLEQEEVRMLEEKEDRLLPIRGESCNFFFNEQVRRRRIQILREGGYKSRRLCIFWGLGLLCCKFSFITYVETGWSKWRTAADQGWTENCHPDQFDNWFDSDNYDVRAVESSDLKNLLQEFTWKCRAGFKAQTATQESVVGLQIQNLNSFGCS